VLVGGLAADYCVKHTALELRAAGFRVILNHAATRGVAPETTAQAFAEMAAAEIEFIEQARDLASIPGGQHQ
jgi:nicotinamidase/pyrazinamidase